MRYSFQMGNRAQQAYYMDHDQYYQNGQEGGFRPSRTPSRQRNDTMSGDSGISRLWSSIRSKFGSIFRQSARHTTHSRGFQQDGDGIVAYREAEPYRRSNRG